MKRINIVWCDDTIDTIVTEAVLEQLRRHDCNLYKTARTTKQLEDILNDKESKSNIDAVIVDFNVGKTEEIPDKEAADGFFRIHDRLDIYEPLPFYLYSARDMDFIKEKYKDHEVRMEGDYFFEPNKNVSCERNRHFEANELEQLLKMVKEEVSSLATPEFKIRSEYSEAFATLERFNQSSEVFMRILLADENTDRYQLCNMANSLRKVLEGMMSNLKSANIIPKCSLNNLPKLLRGDDPKSVAYKSQDFLPKSLSKAFEFVVSYAQDGSHNNKLLDIEFDNYLRTSRDSYIVKALAIIVLDVVKWMGEFYDKYEGFKLFPSPPFKTQVIEEIKNKDGKDYIVMKDNSGMTYIALQHPSAKYKYSVGSNVEIMDRTNSGINGYDYFVKKIKNLDVP